jgi:hypothetical protein
MTLGGSTGRQAQLGPGGAPAAAARTAASGLRLYLRAVMFLIAVVALARVFALAAAADISARDPGQQRTVVSYLIAFRALSLVCATAALFGLVRYLRSSPREVGRQIAWRIGAGVLVLALLADIAVTFAFWRGQAETSIPLFAQIAGYLTVSFGMTVSARELGAPSATARALTACILLLVGGLAMAAVVIGAPLPSEHHPQWNSDRGNALSVLYSVSLVLGMCFHVAAALKLSAFVESLAHFDPSKMRDVDSKVDEPASEVAASPTSKVAGPQKQAARYTVRGLALGALLGPLLINTTNGPGARSLSFLEQAAFCALMAVLGLVAGAIADRFFGNR